jgi:quinolinate synthase
MNEKELVQEIERLKKEKNALILAHNYQIPEIQAVADILGDSLKLSIEAAKTDKDIIVFCGVKFMAESAKLLSPDKKVLLPALDAGCPMADMQDAEALREMKEKYPGVPVVTYVNSNTDVKAETDICCTSSNAVNVVKSLDSDRVIFGPDKNLGSYIQQFVDDKEIILWNGFCPTHEAVKSEEVVKVKLKNPGVKILVHPEANPSVVELADFVGSTSQMINYVKENDDEKFIIGTEMGILNIMSKENPEKEFKLLSPKLICVNMKKTNLKSLYDALNEEKHEITIDEDIREKAKLSLDKMIKIN